MPGLKGRKIAFLAKRGFEQDELTEPWKAVEEAGGVPVLVSEEAGTIIGLVGDWDRGIEFPVDLTLDEADPRDYLGLVLPGGTLNSDKIRTNEKAQAFVKAFMDEGKPVAPICHGAWILIETGTLAGRTLTSTTRIRTDLINAGAYWVDSEFHRDGNLLSSRSPRDIEAFNRGIIAVFEEAAAQEE
ncbi:protease I [Arcanobacterium pluranimalium]|uniref:type 1 glutamine amidotransferase domain-containing protein n=1 Tax=Arcanobacterium pluranimalium TaxID=108028 RepID=UPI00195869AD|nr:type 1 glutamine amidotransferase domain-containing protein [Arcanobacterium pluranimalium]MBM7825745.1 protease I [Arcanobacterium pluranimalium]